jgi:hypothetical protein
MTSPTPIRRVRQDLRGFLKVKTENLHSDRSCRAARSFAILLHFDLPVDEQFCQQSYTTHPQTLSLEPSTLERYHLPQSAQQLEQFLHPRESRAFEALGYLERGQRPRPS